MCACMHACVCGVCTCMHACVSVFGVRVCVRV